MASYKQSDYETLRRRCVELSQAEWHQMAIAQAFGRFGGPINPTLGEPNPEKISPKRCNCFRRR
jgi:hypothetical protein